MRNNPFQVRQGVQDACRNPGRRRPADRRGRLAGCRQENRGDREERKRGQGPRGGASRDASAALFPPGTGPPLEILFKIRSGRNSHADREDHVDPRGGGAPVGSVAVFSGRRSRGRPARDPARVQGLRADQTHGREEDVPLGEPRHAPPHQAEHPVGHERHGPRRVHAQGGGFRVRRHRPLRQRARPEAAGDPHRPGRRIPRKGARGVIVPVFVPFCRAATALCRRPPPR